jgi:hypothetical protein
MCRLTGSIPIANDAPRSLVHPVVLEKHPYVICRCQYDYAGSVEDVEGVSLNIGLSMR